MKRLSIVEKLQELVRIQSHSEEEGDLAEWILQYLSQLGISAAIKDDNVVAHIEGKNRSRAVIFNGHMDTVAAGDLTLWSYPPTGPDAGVVSDGKLYGLGASDMKASLASFLELAEHYSAEPPPVDIHFSFVTEEETSGRGSAEYVRYFQSEHQRNYEEIICVVGEPTSFQYIELGNRGVRHFELQIEGKACHAARAAGRDTNAPEIAFAAMEKMNALKAQWIKEFYHERLGPPGITMTGMKSSPSSANAVPSTVTLRWDIRTTPNFHEEVEGFLREAFASLGEVREVRVPCAPAFCPDDSLIAKVFREGFPKVEHRLALGGNDCGAFIAIGISAVTFGPGLKEIIHQVDEFAPLRELEASLQQYNEVVTAFARLE